MGYRNESQWEQEERWARDAEWEKREFKRQELEWELRHEEEDNDEDYK